MNPYGCIFDLVLLFLLFTDWRFAVALAIGALFGAIIVGGK